MRKTLVQSLLSITKISRQTLTNCRTSSSASAVRRLMPKNPGEANIAPKPRNGGISRRFLYRTPMLRPEILQIPMGENLMEKLGAIDASRDRIQLQGLAPPMKSPVEEEASPGDMSGLTVEEAKKHLRAAEIEMVKARLREMGKSWISGAEFVRICGEASSDPEQGSRIAKMLDESGNVIVLGNSVFLTPEMVTISIQDLLPVPGLHFPNDPRRKEFKDLEAQKVAIDKKAKSLVRTELWAGLGFLAVQTAGFMRLTFWELSWDVMEPICFYVTSIYFMSGYTFFLRTSKEPSFEGFYRSRFETKQKKLMKDSWV